MKLVGPFSQLLTLSALPLKGALADEQLQIIPNAGILIDNGLIVASGHFRELRKAYPDVTIEEIYGEYVLLPGFIDSHTHICYAGNRAPDYAMRNSGKTYLEIAEAGGGIWDSVSRTRAATEEHLVQQLLERVGRHLSEGITTLEVKSGYGLNFESELKQLRAIRSAAKHVEAELIPACLAAHILPKDFEGNSQAYLDFVLRELLPTIQQEDLCKRVDIFIEESAFNPQDALVYLEQAKTLGFFLTVHADQFTTGGSEIAVQVGAVSADHLEASTEKEIRLLTKSNTVAVVLPGASMGLGMPFAPARRLLNSGACLAIASDWNPGSAPMGDLLMQAAVMGAYEKLTAAEIFAALTFRSAYALRLLDRGALMPGSLADLQAYPCQDYREILYNQGKLKPTMVWKNGQRIKYSI